MKPTLSAILLSVAMAGAGTAEDIIKSDVTVAQGVSAGYGYLGIGSENSTGSLTNNGEVNANQIYIYDGWLVNNGVMNDVADEDDQKKPE